MDGCSVFLAIFAAILFPLAIWFVCKFPFARAFGERRLPPAPRAPEKPHSTPLKIRDKLFERIMKRNGFFL